VRAASEQAGVGFDQWCYGKWRMVAMNSQPIADAIG